MTTVLTLGEPMAVMYPTEPVTLDVARTLGLDLAGAESNFAIGLARLGVSVKLFTRLGADRFGDMIRAIWKREGVDASDVIADPNFPTGIYFREWLPDGERRVLYYRKGSAAAQMTPDELKPEWFDGLTLLHLTGITPALSDTCAATCQRALDLAKAAGAKVSFDPNYRAKLWSPEAARRGLLPIIQQADWLLLGHEDARAVLGTEDDDEILRQGAALGPSVVVLKRAERGAVAWAEGRRWESAAVPVAKAVDPVGAGDGFDAGFVTARLRGWDMERALHAGNKIGAACVAVLGDYAGYPREI
jgi:2-dehydro-3-deoxygluconokinase